ncbi:MAG: FMN reductase [Deltaproteobacteria bacterium RBG_13_52_11b]|nr:MAG: FMN reductase [Deltaproteobacteria bacterium RBG_13_52_11b]
MNVVAFNGSPRKEGNTYLLVQKVFEELRKEGIETEYVHIGGKGLRGCTACFKCKENKDKKCALPDDGLNGYIEKMERAQGIILASPVYFSNITAEMTAFIDRAGYVTTANGKFLRRKVGAAVVAVRRAGANIVYSNLNFFFGIQEMVVPGSSYWNLGIGRDIGDVLKDEEGLATMKTLGQNMAWVLKKLNG